MMPTYPRDRTENGVSTLTTWFRGDSAKTAETLYVALNGSAVVYHDNPNATLIKDRTEEQLGKRYCSGAENLIIIQFGQADSELT